MKRRMHFRDPKEGSGICGDSLHVSVGVILEEFVLASATQSWGVMNFGGCWVMNGFCVNGHESFSHIN